MSQSPSPEHPSAMRAIGRGLRGSCPACGQGKLWKSYLKQVDSCASCHEELGKIRADDGPPWLTMLLVGHILAPILVLVTGTSETQPWMVLVGLLALGLGMCLAILPLAKALFLAIIWRSRPGDASAHEQNSPY